jgi:hypothetical protein
VLEASGVGLVGVFSVGRFIETVTRLTLAVLSVAATITIGVGIDAYSPVDSDVRNLQGGMQ